jgi:polyadenylate-binding protein
VTEMLLSLSKKERAMCLFSAEYLRSKVESARSILDALAEEEEPTPPSAQAVLSRERANLAVNTPTTPQPQHRISGPGAAASLGTPQTPELSYTGGSTTASPSYPQTPAGVSSGHTLATLAKLPAAEIVRLASSPQSTGLPVPKADPNVVKSTDEFVNGLVDKTAAVQKQLLGEKLCVISPFHAPC